MKAKHHRDLELPIANQDLLQWPIAKVEQYLEETLAQLKGLPGEKFNKEENSSWGVRILLDSTGGYWDFIKLYDGIILSINDLLTSGHEEILVQGEDLIKFRFIMEGALEWHNDAQDSSQTDWGSAGPCAVFSIHPLGKDARYGLKPNEHLKMLTLHCTREALGNLFPPELCSLFEVVRGQDNKAVVSEILPYTPTLILMVNEILCSTYEGDLRRIFTKAKVLELLCVICEMLGNQRQEPELPIDIRLSSNDLERLEKIKIHIESNLTIWPTSKELAKMAAFNVKKLIYGFKKVYGLTPYDYAIEYRMQKSVDMLKHQNLPVSQAAYKLGYSHPANFATAFKKRFGFQPRSLSNQMPV